MNEIGSYSFSHRNSSIHFLSWIQSFNDLCIELESIFFLEKLNFNTETHSKAILVFLTRDSNKEKDSHMCSSDDFYWITFRNGCFKINHKNTFSRMCKLLFACGLSNSKNSLKNYYYNDIMSANHRILVNQRICLKLQKRNKNELKPKYSLITCIRIYLPSFICCNSKAKLK